MALHFSLERNYCLSHTMQKNVVRIALFTFGILIGLCLQSIRTALPPQEEQSIQRKEKAHPKCLFVFFAGVEGTGHHLFSGLYRDASTAKSFYDQHGKLRESLIRLQTLLYKNGHGDNALFSASASSLRKKNPGKPNGTQIFHQVVGLLRETHQNVTQALVVGEDQHTPFPIPLNTLFTGPGVGMLSYPNFLVPYRALQYPDLHLLYRACQMAEVPCGHVYMHRNPYSVIRSTVQKRMFWPLEGQIALLSTMLSVLRSQLTDFPDNLVSCFDFDGGMDHDESSEDAMNFLRPLLRFLRISEANFTRLFNVNNTASHLDLTTVVDPRVQVYMDTFAELSNATMELCQRIQSSGQGWLSPANST